jgi:hypothetical protein
LSKFPKQRETVRADKQVPRSKAIPQTPEGISWRFSILDRDGPYGWSKCDSAEKYLEILFKKKDIEKMSWTDLRHGGSHPVETYKLAKEARDRLVEIKLDDQDELLSLRISGKNRIWCVRDKNVIFVVWWDPDHLVCARRC